ncbi:hypothetical protein MKX01_004664 [Papaver californicum]|nr:hypothetical protein MKX01_004664 [Papaver californicum]
MLGTDATIAREEGMASLWKGIIPGLHRHCICEGLRIGLCKPVKSIYIGSDFFGDVPLSKKILAALTTDFFKKFGSLGSLTTAAKKRVLQPILHQLFICLHIISLPH